MVRIGDNATPDILQAKIPVGVTTLQKSGGANEEFKSYESNCCPGHSPLLGM
jgi:hypothetical protein